MSCYKKCKGCGKALSDDVGNIAYAPDVTKNYCQRCFKLINYNQNTRVDETKESIKNIHNAFKLKDSDFVFMILDALNIDGTIVTKMLDHKNIAFIINKIDLLYRNLNLNIMKEKIEKLLEKYKINNKEIFLLSSKTNVGGNSLIEFIEKLPYSQNIYFVGKTNVGKSSLINLLIKKSGVKQKALTISQYANTTSDFNKLIIFKHKIIDTPGFIDDFDQKINEAKPLKSIRPLNFVLTKDTSFLIADIFLVSLKVSKQANIVFFNNTTSKIIKISNSKKQLGIKESFGNDINFTAHKFDKFESDKKYNISLSDFCTISFKNVDVVDISARKNINLNLIDEAII